MKKTLVSLLAVPLIISSVACGKTSKAENPVTVLEQKVEEIQWNHSFEEAQAIAQKEQEPMMVDFTVEWCGWCVKLDETTFKDLKVVKLSKNYVNVKVDVDRGNNKKFVKRYKVGGYPTILFLREDGSELKRVRGYQKAKRFTNSMEEALLIYKKK